MTTKDKINNVKINLDKIELEFKDKKAKQLNSLKGIYRFNNSMQKVVIIRDIDRDYLDCLDCLELRTTDFDDFIFSKRKLSINEFLTDYPIEDEYKAKDCIKNILIKLSKEMSVSLDTNNTSKENNK